MAILAGCGPAAPPATIEVAPGQSPAATIGLPAEWTAFPTQPTSASQTPSLTMVPTLTYTPHPSFTPRPTFTPSPTPDLSSPFGVVKAAFAAYLRGDEAALRGLYSQDGQSRCNFFSIDLIHCIGIAYEGRALGALEQWYVAPEDATWITDHLVVVFVKTAWRGSNQTWSQYFNVSDDDGRWLISENDTTIYPASE